MRRGEVAKAEFLNQALQDESMYCVFLYDGDQLMEVRPLPGKSIHYAQDVSENWENGTIKLNND